jgi:hypothetical protein
MSRIGYDSNSALREVKALAPGNGYTTLYTAPANKTAVIMSSQGMPFRTVSYATVVFDAGATSGSQHVDFYLVPPNGSPGTANLITTISSNNAGVQFTTPNMLAVIPPGYSIVIGQSFASTAESVYIFVFEF